VLKPEVLCMKLNYDRKSKDPTYFIQQGIRNGKKVTTKNVKRILSAEGQQGSHEALGSGAREYREGGIAGKPGGCGPGRGQ
ncbi:MAG: hypothetical protein IKG87_06700, partial [Clostridia bacterium]|nr:hypothetical protein [Clostridia bacterium]